LLLQSLFCSTGVVSLLLHMGLFADAGACCCWRWSNPFGIDRPITWCYQTRPDPKKKSKSNSHVLKIRSRIQVSMSCPK
jgi:hypothetical protein